MKLRYSLMVSLCLLALPGCQSRPQETSAAPTVASETTAAQPDSGKTSTESAQNESKSPSESSVDLKELTDLVGKTDSEVTAVLGQGEEMKNGEGLILERSYTLPLLGEDADVSLTFNLYQEGADLLEQATVNLGQSSLDDYAQSLTQLFGEPTETYEDSYFFVSGSKTLVLADPYGDGAYIEISAGE
ncbi:MAG TPA: Ice-structuring protein [Candidatus Lachnoclostridium avicola]|nr:Ice-structuring protein [Candidatus Lachnoclostridium avicola]